MTTRHINKSLIRALIEEKGITNLAATAKCSTSLLQKLVSDDYETIPTIRKIDGLCFATGKSIDELFPVFEAKKESA